MFRTSLTALSPALLSEGSLGLANSIGAERKVICLLGRELADVEGSAEVQDRLLGRLREAME